jgi:broad specificity phosphatase PhoE
VTSTPTTTMVLIRHAEPAASGMGLCYGALDVPLSEDGVIHAQRIGAHLRDSQLDAVYSGPLSRAVATASAVSESHGLTPVLRRDLSEIDFGAFEGRTFDEIAVSHPELYGRWMREPARVRFPGGESFDDLRGRVCSEIARIRREHRGGSVVVVTHGGPIRALMAELLGLESGLVFRIGQSWGGMTSVEWVGDDPIVRSMNVVV